MNIKIIRLLLVLSIVAFLFSGCIIISPGGCSSHTVKGSGNVVSEDRTVSVFDEIQLKGTGNVILTKGEMQSIEIVTDDNILPLIETHVRNKILSNRYSHCVV